MKHKIILPIIGAIAVVVITTLIVFANRYTTSNIAFANPKTINIYYKSQTVKKTLDSSTDGFEDLVSAFSDTFKKSFLEQVAEDDFINPTVEEYLEGTAWSDYNKDDGLFLEFVFEKAQKMIISREGNTRTIYITSIIFELDETTGVKNNYLYYAIDEKYVNDPETTGDSEIYYPLIVQGDTTKLYSTIKELV